MALLFHFDETGLSVVRPYLALLCIFGGFYTALGS